MKAVTLDSEIAVGERVDFLKIDAEGAEPFILRGAKKVLSENHNIKIIMEFSRKQVESSFGSFEDFYEEIDDLGFAVREIMHDSSLRLIKKDDLLDLNYCDVVLSRR